ncbi:anion permease [Bacillus canaveralius]|uniref:Anion permease n=1 Tax=Bacillus canaveralius TaxID=1403243 RepID=A0A2N5GPV2_9BACI|nr:MULTISPECIES: inorganic phosphate transporter [Bacillus]PLR84773.1 anion permease [Bacillus canaveralius]PLR84974.1 anion permease [Bacillus sp. V33-4]PLS00399.1 anion permease [Bacillus canaveralius]RSK52221.1 inorganic phosphate transporter [Bacillus canaveralius]
MILTYITCIVALFFAMNIGASGAAASISIAYGSGAIPSRRKALVLCGIAIFAGAAVGGSEVVKTIGTDIIPQSLLTVKVVLIILSSAAISLFIANLMGIPLSTSEITVGSVVGVGIAYQALYINNILVIVSFWIIVPAAGFAIALLLGKFIKKLEKHYPGLKNEKMQKTLAVFVIIVGFFEAFSAGMNNVANAVGPLVGAGIVPIHTGILIGGLFIALGAIFMGGGVLQTNGKKITNFSLLEGGAISGTGAFLVILASIYGLPVPLTQVTSTAIIGIGASQNGWGILKKKIINKILKVWIVSPIVSLVVSYSFVKIFVESDLYSVIVLFSVCAATLGTLSLAKTIREDGRIIYEKGGGI